MSSVGSEVGGKVGGDMSVDQTQFPYFTSPGGVTPQQTSLGEYNYGQNLTEGQANFGGGDEGGGNAMSTMATQTATGANTGEALSLAGMSDVNQGAANTAYSNAENISQQNNTNALAQNDQNLTVGLSDLAQLQSTAAKAGGTALAANTPVPGASQ